MECPYCGKNNDKVIDSRLSKDEIVIRRRRQCLICSNRFSTYEAVEEQLLPFLIERKAGLEATAKNLKNMASFMSMIFKELSEEVEVLVDKMGKLEKAQTAKELGKRARERKAARRKAALLVLTETVFKIIKRYKKGVHISRLREKTGLDDNKLQNILLTLRKEGKIKNVVRGVYIKK